MDDTTVQALGAVVLIGGAGLATVLGVRAARKSRERGPAPEPATEISPERWRAAADAFRRGRAIEDPDVAAIVLREYDEGDPYRDALRAWRPVGITLAVLGVALLALGLLGGSRFLVVGGAIVLVPLAVFRVRSSNLRRRTQRSLEATRRLGAAGDG